MRLSDHQTHRPRREHSLRLQINRVLTHHFLCAPTLCRATQTNSSPGLFGMKNPLKEVSAMVGVEWKD